MEIFDRPTQLLEKVLDFTSEKNSLISSNLANRDTPGFKAQDLAFENQLKQAYEQPKESGLKLTDPRHISGLGSADLSLVQGEIFNVFNPEPKMDGNTVDLDQEMSKLAKNQLLYEAAVSMISHKFSTLRSAIEEGGR